MAITAHDDEAAARIRRFIADHAGTDAGTGAGTDHAGADHAGAPVAVVEHLGRAGARIVVIAASGEFGDALASSVDEAHAVCERLGLEVREWDRELTTLISPTRADRERMGRRQR